MATRGEAVVAPASSLTDETPVSAVSWAAILAGAVVAVAATLVLFALGSGLGFAAASPWPGSAPSATTFAIGAGIWLIITQWLSSALGGYITGRLRTRWTRLHTHEVFFRDTAHGFLTWALATVFMAAVAIAMGSSAAGTAANAAGGSVGYAADTLVRPARPGTPSADAARAEIGRILARGDRVDDNDRSYLASLVSDASGVSRKEAETRVATAETSVRDAADKARKASSAAAFAAALSMVMGAFIASIMASFAGRIRDEHL